MEKYHLVDAIKYLFWAFNEGFEAILGVRCETKHIYMKPSVDADMQVVEDVSAANNGDFLELLECGFTRKEEQGSYYK